MQSTVLTAPDIVCGGCASAIKNALGRIAGVSDVAVDIATKRVTVTHDVSVTRHALTAALDRAGFPVAV